MQVTLANEISIEAPAQKVWQVLAHQYEDIGQWASGIAASHSSPGGPVPEGAKCSGRVCSAASKAFGEVEEVFTYYEEEAMRFGYKATSMPAFMRTAENNWHVKTIEPGKCVAEFSGDLDLWFIPGVFVVPIFKFMGKRVLEELKYYVEEGKPHPRKVKALEK